MFAFAFTSTFTFTFVSTLFLSHTLHDMVRHGMAHGARTHTHTDTQTGAQGWEGNMKINPYFSVWTMKIRGIDNNRKVPRLLSVCLSLYPHLLFLASPT